MSPTGELVTFFSRNHFEAHELEALKQDFHKFDKENAGTINSSDFEHFFEALGMKISPVELEKAFGKCGLRKNSSVSFAKFLEVLGATRELKSRQSFSSIVKEPTKVPTDRSGGGV